MADKPLLISPVAEYLRIAIVERGGDVEKSWKGNKYHTDGKLYIVRRQRTEDGMIQIIAFDTERLVKEYVDDMLPDQRTDFLSMIDIWKEVLHQPVMAVPDYKWNEVDGCFVETEALVDGMTRMRTPTNFLKGKV